jgi:hypothetical protein
MRERRCIDPDFTLVDQKSLEFGQGAILLAGKPPRCTGELVVRNPRDEGVRVERIFVFPPPVITLESTAGSAPSSATDPGVDACAEPPEGAIELRLSGRLQPRESRVMRAQLTVAAGTAPGGFEATLEGANGAHNQVIVQVLEDRALRINPSLVTRSVTVGEKTTVQVSALNPGNVAQEIPTGTTVQFHAADQSWLGHFHAAAATSGSKGFEDFSNDFVGRMGKDEPPVGRAKIVSGAGSLAPLAVRLLEIEVQVPAKLRANREYVADMRLGDGRFRMRITSVAAKVEELRATRERKQS